MKGITATVAAAFLLIAAGTATADNIGTDAGKNKHVQICKDGTTIIIKARRTHGWRVQQALKDGATLGACDAPLTAAGSEPHAGYCMNGVFFELVLDQPAEDPAYASATPAFFVAGLGATCDVNGLSLQQQWTDGFGTFLPAPEGGVIYQVAS